MRRSIIRIALAVAIGGLAAACSDDADSGSSPLPEDANAEDTEGADAPVDADSPGVDSAGPDTTIPSDTIEDADSAPDAEADGTEEPDPPAAPWYRDAVVYEVFVRSFMDSDGDGIGDFQGLIDRLDYINDGVPGAGDDLEADAIWLMPVFESVSYHGYDVVDYGTIEADYGGDAGFEAFVEAAEARGIRVILDFVMNHSSSQHPWFVDSASGPNAEHRDWYVWRADNPGWTQPFGDSQVWHPSGGSHYYGVFWSGMPDLNFLHPPVYDEIEALALSWLDRGATGFRIDAARYLVESPRGEQSDLPQTHQLFKDLRAAVSPVHNDVYLVGEAWAGRSTVAQYYGDNDEFHQCFDFDLQLAFESAAKTDNATALRSEISKANSGDTPWDFEATFANNHDLNRLAFRIGDVDQRAVAGALLTLPGTPYIYYGDEYGMKMGPLPGDEAKRTPMAWDASRTGGFTTGAPWAPFSADQDTRNVESQLADTDSLLNLYRSLIRLRKAHPALRGDGIATVKADEPAIFAALRWTDNDLLLVVINLSDQEVAPASLDLTGTDAPLDDGPLTLSATFGPPLSETAFDAADAVDLGVTLLPGQTAVFTLLKPPTP